jgi:hypothetical protein
MPEAILGTPHFDRVTSLFPQVTDSAQKSAGIFWTAFAVVAAMAAGGGLAHD